ncbi:MAG TPA: hypothetical protein VNH53_09075 [Sphingomicrobium sp.]|nr:hypothetical protein [Sphingomicrobium sp.]
MDGTPRERLIEWLVDSLAAASLAAASAFASLELGGSIGWSVAAACAGFLLAYAGLRGVQPEPATYPLAAFAPEAVETGGDVDELLLGPEMLIAVEAEGSELVLDDILASIAPDSRVVPTVPARPAADGRRAQGQHRPALGQGRAGMHTTRRHRGAPPSTGGAATLAELIPILRGS